MGRLRHKSVCGARKRDAIEMKKDGYVVLLISVVIEREARNVCIGLKLMKHLCTSADSLTDELS